MEMSDSLDLENSFSLHRVDRRNLDPTLFSHVLNLQSSFGRFFLRSLSIALFILIVCVLTGLLISNLVVILDRTEGIIQSSNVALYFSSNACFVTTEVICFILVSIFFRTDSDERLDERGKEIERVYRGYMVVDVCCLVSFLSYLVLVEQEFYYQAYWAVFVAVFFFMYCHLRVAFCIAELTEGPLSLQKFEKFSAYYYYFSFVSFFGLVCLVLDTLILSNQQPRIEDD